MPETPLRKCGAPSSAGASVDGINLVPVLNGAPLPSRTLCWHYPHYANQGSKPGGATFQLAPSTRRVVQARRSVLFPRSPKSILNGSDSLPLLRSIALQP